VAVSLPGVIDGIPICDFGGEGTWVFGKRVEGESVDREDC
jgi:hypothetical protein